MSDDPGILLTAKLVQLQSQLDAQGRRLAIVEELLRPTPVPPPPTIKPGLTVRDGSFWEGDKPLKSFGVNVAGYGIDSKPEERDRLLDQLRDMGVKVVRFLHPADDIVDGIDDFKPTRAEVLKGFPELLGWMDALAQRGMYAHLTVLHRQRLTREEAATLKTPGLADFLFGPRPSGIAPGEISDLAFVFDELRELVENVYIPDYGRFAKHPAMGMIDCINESWSSRVRGYYPFGDRPRTDHTAYGIAWFKQLDEYEAEFAKTDKEMTTPELVRFRVRVGLKTFKSLIAKMREVGFTCPIGTSSLYGVSTVACLAEATVGDYVNVHLYPENDAEPNPFDPQLDVAAHRSVGSVLAASSLANKPVVLTECAGVYQNGALKGTKTPTYNVEPAVIAKAAAVHGVPVTNFYCAAFGPMPTAKTVYDAFAFPEFVTSFGEAAKLYRETPLASAAARIQLTDADICGTEVRGVITRPEVVGSQAWAKNAAAMGIHCVVNMPESVTAWSN